MTFASGYKDKKQYWRSARSGCCNSWLVYYNQIVSAWVHWAGHTALPDELRCRRCNRVVYRSDREDRALEALIVSVLRTDELDLDHLPELTADETVALDSLGPDFVERLLRTEAPSAAYWSPEDPRWLPSPTEWSVPADWCPGGKGCTCCRPGCDCGCRDECPVFRAAMKTETEP